MNENRIIKVEKQMEKLEKEMCNLVKNKSEILKRLDMVGKEHNSLMSEWIMLTGDGVIDTIDEGE